MGWIERLLKQAVPTNLPPCLPPQQGVDAEVARQWDWQDRGTSTGMALERQPLWPASWRHRSTSEYLAGKQRFQRPDTPEEQHDTPEEQYNFIWPQYPIGVDL